MGLRPVLLSRNHTVNSDAAPNYNTCSNRIGYSTSSIKDIQISPVQSMSYLDYTSIQRTLYLQL